MKWLLRARLLAWPTSLVWFVLPPDVAKKALNLNCRAAPQRYSFKVHSLQLHYLVFWTSLWVQLTLTIQVFSCGYTFTFLGNCKSWVNSGNTKFFYNKHEDNLHIQRFIVLSRSNSVLAVQFVTIVLLQGGIALTSPPCNKKKQTSGLTEKGPVRLSNTCCEMGVVKAAS